MHFPQVILWRIKLTRMASVSNMQLGKSGITDNFIITLKDHFKNNQNVKVSVMRSILPEKGGKKQVEKYSEEILEKLGKKYTARVLGFCISIKKWRRDMRE